MIWRALERYRDIGLLLLRLGVGLGFPYFHGWAKLSGGPERWTSVGAAMEHFGIRFGHVVFGFLAAFSETVGGLLIALGLLFRPAAVLLLATMAVATTRHLATGQGTPAHAFKNAWVFLGLLFVGPGKYSLDYLIEQRGRRSTG